MALFCIEPLSVTAHRENLMGPHFLTLSAKTPGAEVRYSLDDGAADLVFSDLQLDPRLFYRYRVEKR